jgi:hypothetical protein
MEQRAFRMKVIVCGDENGFNGMSKFDIEGRG